MTSPLSQLEREADNLAAATERLADVALDLLSAALDSEAGPAAEEAVRI
ncbi:MAG: hypothetical protein RL743_391, partial [Actinomycetota bacterium]